MGVIVKDTSRDRSVAATTVTPNWRKNWPTMSERNAMGAKTTTSHSVMATAASPISILPRTAAVRASSPRRMWRSTFSRMTMESSTRIPMQSPRAMRLTMFRVKWNRYMAKNVPTREKGMAIRTMREDLHRRRKRKRTSEVVMMLSRRFSRVSSREELMKSVASAARLRCVPGASDAWMEESAFFTRVAVSMRFALLCLRTTIPMALFPFRRTERTGSG